MLRAYQSPSIGTACGPQWAQNPSFASRNHSGHLYCLNDSNSGWNGPGAMGSMASAAAGVDCTPPGGSAARTTAQSEPASADTPRTVNNSLQDSRPLIAHRMIVVSSPHYRGKSRPQRTSRLWGWRPQSWYARRAMSTVSRRRSLARTPASEVSCVAERDGKKPCGLNGKKTVSLVKPAAPGQNSCGPGPTWGTAWRLGAGRGAAGARYAGPRGPP